MAPACVLVDHAVVTCGTAPGPPVPDRAVLSPDANDRTLVEQMAGGDERAAGLLYDRHGAVLFALARRIVREPADAEEVVMEAFAQAWRDAARFEPGRGSVAGWLVTIVRSRALDHVRARGRRWRITGHAARAEPEGAPALGMRSDNPAAAPELEERRTRVRAALDALPPVQREAIELAYYEGLTQSEIAARLEAPLGTVKTRIRSAMEQLRQALQPLLGEQGS